MTKIGVGVGEEFPTGESEPAETSDKNARREAHRKWRAQRREWKHQWRNEWRCRKRTFRREIQNRIHKDRDFYWHAGEQNVGDIPLWSSGVLWAVFGVIAAIAAISFLLSQIFILVGIVALLALFVAYHREHDPFAVEPYAGPHHSPVPRATAIHEPAQ